MNKSLIIADSSPLISLSIIGQLDLLRELYSKVLIPQGVWQEIVIDGAGLPGAQEVSKLDWIEIQNANPTISDSLAILIDKGEAEAIALATQLPDCTVLLDDARARRVAERFNLRRIGTVGILRRAKKKGLLNKIKPFIEKLQLNGIYISQKLVDLILKDVGE